MTHLACADGEDLATTREQLRAFDEASARVHAAGLSPTIRHAANSAGAVRVAASRFDVVRPGIGLFGYKPWSGTREASAEAGLAELRPVMKVRTEIVAVRNVPTAGASATATTSSRAVRAASPPSRWATPTVCLARSRTAVT